MSTAALRPQPERPCATAALRVFELVGVRALRVRVRPGPGRSRCRTAWPGWSHAMTGFLDSTSACGSIGRRGGIEFSNGVIIDSNLGVECELVRRAFWTNPQQVDHPLLAALGAHCPAFVGLPALNGQYGQMRVGTWNLAGRWSPHHLELLLAQECDVWLLTEVRADVSLAGFESHLTAAKMAPRRHWAGIYSRTPIQPRPDPHPASAAAYGLGLTWCSSILPWRSCGTVPWGDGAAKEKTQRALDQLASELPVGAVRACKCPPTPHRTLGRLGSPPEPVLVGSFLHFSFPPCTCSAQPWALSGPRRFWTSTPHLSRLGFGRSSD